MTSQKIGFLFPGQGAQYVGMGKDWTERFSSARAIFQQADKLLEFGLTRICFDGPEDVLTRTLYAQPAIFVTSLAVLAVLQERLPELKPAFTAGLSLGEFTALVAAGSLSFKEGLYLVQKRAELMEDAARESRGSMLSILGLDQQTCTAIAKESGVDLANLNAPDQFVLSGEESGIERAGRLAGGKGAKRVIRLKVGGAFHSRLMNSAKEGLLQALKRVSLQTPYCTFVANATGRPESDLEQIRTLLGAQLTSPVRWFETMESARNCGISRLIEIGPGRVLKGLAKRIDPSLEVLSLEKFSELEAVKERCYVGG